MKFLIMTRLPEIYSSQRLVQEATRRGHQALTVHPEDDWGLDLHGVPEEGSIVIPRLGNFRYPESMAHFEAMESKYSHLIQRHELKLMNTPRAFHLARHKWKAHQTLGSLPQPRNYSSAEFFPVVVKDCVSSKGDGVFLCHNNDELQDCLEKLKGRELFFQEFIAESAGQDLRAFVIGNEIVASMGRRASADHFDFRANLSLGGTAFPVNLTTEEEVLCREAVQRLNLQYAGVDLVRSHRGPLILEVNPCPGLEGIEACTHINVAEKMVIYAESLFRSDS